MRIKDIPKTCPVENTKCSTTGVERPTLSFRSFNEGGEKNYVSKYLNIHK